jgi:hypothetical protein
MVNLLFAEFGRPQYGPQPSIRLKRTRYRKISKGQGDITFPVNMSVIEFPLIVVEVPCRQRALSQLIPSTFSDLKPDVLNWHWTEFEPLLKTSK